LIAIDGKAAMSVMPVLTSRLHYTNLRPEW
jgi:hypothetical protein